MAEPVLTLFERNIWRRKSALDPAQVAADGVTVSFYGQGATVSEEAYVPANNPTPVLLDLYDRGDITLGDFVQLGINASAVMRVVSVPTERNKFEVVNSSASDITIAAGDRLVRLTDRPSVYADPHGMQSLKSEISIPGGRLSVYIAATRFDYITSGSGASTALYRDAMGGSSPNPSWVAVLDHQLDLQASIDALPSYGGEVFLPASTYVLPSTLVLNKDNVSLRGQGNNTIITGPANPSFDLVRIEGRFCRLSDLAIDGNATSSAAGKSCLVVTGELAQQVFLKNLLLRKASKYGLEVLNAGQVFGLNCESRDNYHYGLHLHCDTATPLLVRLVACTAKANASLGALIEGLGGLADSVTLLGCLLDDGIEAAALNGLQLVGCRLEWTGSGAGLARLLGADTVRGLVVDGCWFDGQAGAANPALQGAMLDNCQGAAFSSNVGARLAEGLVTFTGCDQAVEMGNRDLDSPGPPRIETDSPLFGLSKGVVEPFRYQSTPADAESWPSGTMFWDHIGLRVVDDGTLKTVDLA